MRKIKRVGSKLIFMLAVASLGISLVSCGNNNSAEIADLKNQIAEMQESQNTKDELIKDLTNELQAEKNKNAQLTASIDGYKNAQTEWENARTNLLTQIDNLNAQIKDLEEGDGKAELQAQLAETLAALAVAQAKADEYKEQLGTLPTENSQLKQQVASLQLDISWYKTNVENLQNTIRDLSIKLEERENSNIEFLDYLNRLEENIKTVRSENAILKYNINTLNQTIEELKAENEELKSELEELRNQD